MHDYFSNGDDTLATVWLVFYDVDSNFFLDVMFYESFIIQNKNKIQVTADTVFHRIHPVNSKWGRV